MGVIFLKSSQEIEIMRRAAKVAFEIHRVISEKIKPGITTKYLDELSLQLMTHYGVLSAYKGYNGYTESIITDVNNVVMHGPPSQWQILREGDLITVHIGVIKDGFYASKAVCYAVGKIDEKASRLLSVTNDALWNGISACQVGNRISDISRAVQETVESEGFQVVRAFGGHGIGRNNHEAPFIPNFVSEERPGMKLRAGLVIKIHPIVTVGSPQVEILSDGWSAVTVDGSLSASVSETVAITDEGPMVLTGLLRSGSVDFDRTLINIHDAVAAGDLESVRENLVASPESLHSSDGRGWRPLHVALNGRHSAIARLLVEAGADVDQDCGPQFMFLKPLHIAAAGGDVTLVSLLISKGAKVDCTDINYRTPLLMAVDKGHIEVAQLLVASGARIEAKDITGRTPLSIASDRQYQHIIEVLTNSAKKDKSKNAGQEQVGTRKWDHWPLKAEQKVVGMGFLGKLLGKNPKKETEKVTARPVLPQLDKSAPLNLKEDNSQRGKLERLVLTYLKAARYLATCGKFNEDIFDKVEQILSTHEWYTPKPERLSEMKAQVQNLIVTDTGLAGWDHMKVTEHQSLSEAITTFLMTMKQDFPDARTQDFIKIAITEGDEIARLINTTKDQ